MGIKQELNSGTYLELPTEWGKRLNISLYPEFTPAQEQALIKTEETSTGAGSVCQRFTEFWRGRVVFVE